MGVLLVILLALGLAFAIGAAEAGILWAIYTYVICAIFPACPVIGFWSVFWILVGLNIIANLFKSSVTIKKD